MLNQGSAYRGDCLRRQKTTEFRNPQKYSDQILPQVSLSLTRARKSCRSGVKNIELKKKAGPKSEIPRGLSIV